VPVAFYIPDHLRSFTGRAAEVMIDGVPATVRDALAHLFERHPGLRDRVVDEQGQVRPHVNVFVGAESIRFTGGLDTLVPASAEISIIPAISGG
jgi:molybdopterin converting factor small subunit